MPQAIADIKSLAQTTRYPLDAFFFVQRGLEFTVHRMHGEDRGEERVEEAGHSRHVTGRDLCMGLRDLAIREYGLLARTVLRRWNINESADFGRIVFAMVDAQLLQKTDDDTLADFESVFDFATAFTGDVIEL